MMRRRSLAFVLVLLCALTAARSGAAIAHNPDPLQSVPTEPSEGAPLETFAGDVKELIVDDRVAGVAVRYRMLALDDGSRIRLNGKGLDGVRKDSRVEVIGRRNGRTLFVTGARELADSAAKSAPTGANARAQGELRMYHVDYLEAGKSTFEFEVLAADDSITPLHLPVRPEMLQRGMRVDVTGLVLGDGALDPHTITITALPDTEDPVAKLTAKATRTDNLLVILMRFTDSPAQPFTQAQVQAVVAGGAGSGSVAEYFKETSFGQQLLNTTVTPWLSTGAATPASCDWRTMGTLGRTAATAAGYTLSNYHKIAYVFPKVSSCGWLGLGYIGSSGVWINGANSTLIFGHELGHNFGLLHAGSLDCGANTIGGTCSASEYGDPFGIMGNYTTMHVNAEQKASLGWIPAATVRTHTAGTATYTLNPIASAGGSTYAVKVPAAANRTYWLEYRQPIGFDGGMASFPNNGAQVRVAAPLETRCGGCDSFSNDTQLLDMTPATGTFTDAALLVGRSYTDAKYGITFNVLSASASALLVQVAGPGASPAASTTSVASSLNPSTAGASVTFTATVTGSSPTGTVAFTANGATIAGCAGLALSGTGNTRTAGCPTAALTAGSHSIVARYNGDAANAASSSAALAQTVNSAPATGSTNVALATNGATASASSTSGTGYPASSTINNERSGANWGAGGGWRDGTASVWPDWLQVNFNGVKTINRVVVYSLQDNYSYPVEPTDVMTFSLYGLRDFVVQGWNGLSWVTLATVTGNTLVKRAVTFVPFTTDRMRISVSHGLSNYARITEIEAWGGAAGPPPSTNIALARNGATASASSTSGSGFPANSTINDERTGANWGAGGGWRDGTAGVWPDWVQVNFNGSKTIDRVVVYSLQDNYSNPVEPTDTMPFSFYGLRDFTVQAWNGSSWVTLATITGNTLVKRAVTFNAFTTDRIRISVSNGLSNYARIIEIEAWGG